MKYIVWGTGPYCREKIKYMKTNDVVAYVERNRAVFQGIDTILPEEIRNFEYDKIIIMSNHYLDIIPELITKWNIEPEKIVPGIACRPYLPKELELMSNYTEIKVNLDGTLLYTYCGKENFVIAKNEDWKQVEEILCHEKNSGLIKSLSIRPVGKLFGQPRGGSICRYYIDEFLTNHKFEIRGRVLEIADRTYTSRFMERVDESYCLHFDKAFASEGMDFYGDLIDGTGMRKEFYDCIILTQVLNCIKDIRNTPQILIDSLKPGGTLLITVSGISPVSRLDMDRWGYFWNFTDAAILGMFEAKNTECDIEIYGNYKVACAFLGGMSYTELSEEDLKYVDEDFQVLVMAVVRRKF